MDVFTVVQCSRTTVTGGVPGDADACHGDLRTSVFHAADKNIAWPWDLSSASLVENSGGNTAAFDKDWRGDTVSSSAWKGA